VKSPHLLLLSLLAVSGFAAIHPASAQEEVAKGSKLRKELFDLARPHIEGATGCTVLFNGSMKQLGGWAFFVGTIVNKNGGVIQIGPAESGDTAILWVKTDGEWSVLEAEVGFTDVIYLNWPETHGCPGALVGN